MKKIIHTLITLLLLTGCNVFYARKTKLEKVTKTSFNHKIKIDHKDLFQLRIFETKSYTIDSISNDVGYINYLQATGVQNLTSANKHQIVEETYLYLEGISQAYAKKKLSKTHKGLGGKVIYMETYPIIASPKNNTLRTLRESYFNNPYKMYTNIIKKCMVGNWTITDDDYCILSLKITHGSREKHYKVKGKYVDDAFGKQNYFTMYQITHPEVFKDGSYVDNETEFEYINLDEVLGFNKVEIAVDNSTQKYFFNYGKESVKDNDTNRAKKYKKGNDLLKEKKEQGLLFFNVPKEKRIVLSTDKEIRNFNADINKEITHFAIESNELYFLHDNESYKHTNTEIKN